MTPFEEEGNHSEFPNFTRALTRHIVVALTRFADLRVFGPQTSFQHGPLEGGLLKSRHAARRRLSVRPAGPSIFDLDQFSIEALLVDARSGRNLWSAAYKRDLRTAEIAAVRNELADSVVRTLAQPYGVIFSNIVKRRRSANLPAKLTSYDLLVKCYEYEHALSPDLFEPAREGLERVIASEPQYAPAFAGLARLYTSAHRYGIDVSAFTEDPLARARELAHCALRLAPESSEAHRALGMVLWFSGDVEGALAALENSSALNPNDTEVMAERGFRYAVLADWERAEPLLRESFARNPGQPSAYRMGLALFHYAHRDYAQALVEALRIEAQDVANVHVIRAAAAARAGVRAEADAAVNALLRIAPDYGQRVVADLKSRHVEPDLARQIIDGLDEAGLPAVDPAAVAAPLERATA